MQTRMFERHVAPDVEGIDLRHADVLEVLATLEPMSVHLAIHDPPWGQYNARPGVAAPDLRYPVMDEAAIGYALAMTVPRLHPAGRLAQWVCGPLLVEALQKAASGQPLAPWLAVPGLRWVTKGAWVKAWSSREVGYHWRGASEDVLVGASHTPERPEGWLRSGFHGPAAEHSRKPVEWMTDWVRAWVPEGGLVFDAYAGSGAVAQAVLCAGGGRRYIGAELDADRFQQARTRIHRTAMQLLSAT